MAPPGVHARVVVLQAQHAQHGDALGREGLVEFDHIDLIERQAGEGQHLLGGRCGADAHHARCDAGGGHAHHACLGREAVLCRGGLIGQQQRARAVVHAAGVACRHAALGRDDALEFGERFQAGFARVFVLAHHDRVALFLGDGHRHDLARQVPGLLRRHGLELARQGHAVLRFALDLVVGGHVLGSLGHGVDTVLRLHELVDEAPADGGVVHRVGAAEGALGLRHHEGCAAHALHAAGDHQARLTGLDGARGAAHRVQPRAAQSVDGGARHVDRQAGQERGHAGHVAVVLAGLVGAAVEHVGDGGPVHVRVALHQRLDGDGREVTLESAPP